MQALHPLLQSFIRDRNITDQEAFLNPSYDARPDPFLMKDMDVAVPRILRAMEAGEKIAVWSDYDCDGVPGGALMADFFTTVGYPVTSYIPERSEGYGLNREGLEKLKAFGVSLVITVDCGITAVTEAEYAKGIGLDLVISDHHLPQETLPEAVAVLNPHRADCPYPEKDLCGTGVAFKLVEGLVARAAFNLPKGFEKWLLDLVALATVADMVSLTGENRTLVRWGLTVLQRGRRPGMKALFEKMRVPLSSVTEDDLAFSIAPKVNAASRMESPRLAFELLTTQDALRAKELAAKLVKLNDARKLEGARVAKEVKQRVQDRPLESVIVLGNSSWKPSLLGIAATNVVEVYGRTVCLWGKEGDLIKGSCRSDGSVNIVSLMSEAADSFEDFGGHEFSGGFSVKQGAIHTLSTSLIDAYTRAKTIPTRTGQGDLDPIQLSLSECSSVLYRSLRMIAPFGVGNPKPLFTFERLRIERVLRFGSQKEHVRLTLSDESGGTIDGIVFFLARTALSDVLILAGAGDSVSVTGSLEESFFAGKRELRLRLEAVRLVP